MLRAFLVRFRRQESGAIAPLFGLSILVLLILSGVAIDSARSYRIASSAGQALDAAALATAKSLRLENPDDATLTRMATDYFKANFASEEGERVSYGDVALAADRRINKVQLQLHLQVPTTLTALLGKDKMDVAARSTAIYDVRDVELSMMLDVSGSMAGSKMSDLKVAAGDLVDILMDGNKAGSKHRIAIAPFSTAVNAGVYAHDIVANRDQRGRVYAGAGTNCVTDRYGAHAFSDKNPQAGKFGQRSTWCPATSVKPLSDDADDIKEHINDMRADGMTAGHLGIAWAWYLLSPEWDDVWPSESAPKDYDDPEFTKVAILMTDGMFNSTYESDNGDSIAQARALCDGMKTSGVTVYTVGFQVPAEVLPVLKYCATSPNHFFDARDGQELRGTFQTIAKRLSGLRIAS